MILKCAYKHTRNTSHEFKIYRFIISRRMVSPLLDDFYFLGMADDVVLNNGLGVP